MVASATAITGTAGDTYKTAFNDKIDLDENLANALAADALVTLAQLLDGTHLSLEAAIEVTLPSFVKDLADKSTNTTDLYYSAAEAGSKEARITSPISTRMTQYTWEKATH